MKQLYLFLMVALTLAGCNNNANKLVWSDEFDVDGKPDSSKWVYELGMSYNNEQQFYTDRPANSRVEDGFLMIEALKEDIENANYSSARLITLNKQHFLYGRIEARLKVPVGKGTWPAFWMLGTNISEIGWPACGEIDIMENVGFDSLMVHGNVHTKAYNHVMGTNKGNQIEIEKPWEEFHVYAIDWQEDKIDFFIDDQLYFTFENDQQGNPDTWPFDKEHYIILNLAIGGDWGGQQGIDDSKFPHQYIIDYVRVYEN